MNSKTAAGSNDANSEQLSVPMDQSPKMAYIKLNSFFLPLIFILPSSVSPHIKKKNS